MGEMQRFEKHFVNSFLVSMYQRWTGVPRVVAHVRRPVEGPILEVGCGAGATTKELRKHFRRNPYTAIDYDPKQVERAWQRVGSLVTVEQGDVTSLAYPDDRFGLVIEMNVLHHIPDPLRGLQEIHRVLRPGGQFIFMDYAWKAIPALARRLFPPESLFSANEFEAALTGAGFESVRVQGQRQLTGRARKGEAGGSARAAVSREAVPAAGWHPRRHPL